MCKNQLIEGYKIIKDKIISCYLHNFNVNNNKNRIIITITIKTSIIIITLIIK